MTHEEAIAKQLCFKAPELRQAMTAIVSRLVMVEPVWPDEIDFGLPQESANAVGNAFKVLLRAGLVNKTGEYRNSTKPKANGRLVWSYRLANQSLARTFLSRNGSLPATGQQELGL